MDVGALGQDSVLRGTRDRRRARAGAHPPAAALEALAWLLPSWPSSTTASLTGEPDPLRPAAPGSRTQVADRACRSSSSCCSVSCSSCRCVGRRPVAARALPTRARSTSRSTTSSASASSATRSSRRSTCSSPTRRSASAMGGTPRRRSCSRARPAPARPTWPRRWRARPACRSCSCRRPRSSRCTTARPNRKIRSYFKALRKAAREEGGAIGFIEEIDAIAGARSGMRMTRRPTAVGRGAVDARDVERGHRRRRQRAADPAAVVRRSRRSASGSAAGSSTGVNRCLPAAPPAQQAAARAGQHPGHRRHQPGRRPRPRAAAPGPLRPLDPLRPARAGRGRREIIDYYLDQEGARPRARQGRAPRRSSPR